MHLFGCSRSKGAEKGLVGGKSVKRLGNCSNRLWQVNEGTNGQHGHEVESEKAAVIINMPPSPGTHPGRPKGQQIKQTSF